MSQPDSGWPEWLRVWACVRTSRSGAMVKGVPGTEAAAWHAPEHNGLPNHSGLFTRWAPRIRARPSGLQDQRCRQRRTEAGLGRWQDPRVRATGQTQTGRLMLDALQSRGCVRSRMSCWEAECGRKVTGGAGPGLAWLHPHLCWLVGVGEPLGLPASLPASLQLYPRVLAPIVRVPSAALGQAHTAGHQAVESY